MEKISKMDQSTPFGGDDNAALIAELKRQGFKYIVKNEGDGPHDGFHSPLGQEIGMLSPTGYEDIMAKYCDNSFEDMAWQRLANWLKTDPQTKYVQGRLEVMARFLLREIYYVTANEGDILRQAERSQSMLWRRSMMIAGKILSLDLGPVHGS